MCKLKLIKPLIIWALIAMRSAFACDAVNVVPAATTPGSNILLTCRSNVEVRQIAAEINGENWNASYPYLYDDGSHGDQVAGDNIFSLSTDAPSNQGQYQVIFFSVLPDQMELESTPIMLNVE